MFPRVRLGREQLFFLCLCLGNCLFFLGWQRRQSLGCQRLTKLALIVSVHRYLRALHILLIGEVIIQGEAKNMSNLQGNLNQPAGNLQRAAIESEWIRKVWVQKASTMDLVMNQIGDTVTHVSFSSKY